MSMKYSLAFALIWLSLSANGASDPPPAASTPMVAFLMEYLGIKYGAERFDRFVYVAAKRQCMYVVHNGVIEAKYPISTARKGIGNQAGTFKTPQGLHQIAEKVGHGLPPGTIIKSKVPTGEMAEIVHNPKSNGLDLITTRVLHLKGSEEGVNLGGNCDSYSRGIFIHGTHEEGLIGKPASKGCIRMRNDDVADLFEKIEVGTFVVILNN